MALKKTFLYIYLYQKYKQLLDQTGKSHLEKSFFSDKFCQFSCCYLFTHIYVFK